MLPIKKIISDNNDWRSLINRLSIIPIPRIIVPFYTILQRICLKRAESILIGEIVVCYRYA